jgi:cytochrome P450
MTDNVYTRPPITSDVSGATCPVSGLGATFDPFVDPYISDPYAFYTEAREREPVFYSPEIDHWVVTRYDDIKSILDDPETYSSRMAQSPIKPWPKEAVDMLQAQNFNMIPNLSNNDPPSHTQVRHFLQDAFTPRRIAWLEPHVRRLVRDAIGAFPREGEIDLVQDLLYETPARVLFVFLGIPGTDVEKIKRWSEGRALLTWGKPTDQEIINQMPDFIEYIHYCIKLVERLDQNPGDDYTSELLKKLKEESPEGITRDRIVITLFGLLMAGHETTTNQSSNGIRALLQNRTSWERLCATPELIPNAVEEIIRYESSILSWRRVTNRQVEVAGVKVPKDAQVLVMLASGNRDESQFLEGESFDIDRQNASRHLSFGHGIHYCLGAPLARLELRVFLEELTRNVSDMRLVEGQDYRYLPNTTHRGPTSLRVYRDSDRAS